MVIVLEKDQSVKNCRDWERDNFNLIYSYKVSYYNNVKNPCEIVTFLLKKNYMGLKKKSFKLPYSGNIFIPQFNIYQNYLE